MARDLRLAGTAAAAAAAAVAAVVAVAGCSTGKAAVANGPQAGDAGYVSADGTIKVIRAADREPAPAVRGRLLGGSTYDIRDQVGQVIVVNFWASWCPPCRSEQPRLNDVYDAVHAKGVQFLGVDLRDEDAQALAFRRTHDVRYPSIVDESGAMLLGFRGIPATPPSTVVIDRDGRVAARVIGQTPNGVLLPIVQQILAEGSTAP